MHTREHLLEHLDIEYSYKLARRMEQFRSNEVLGYRPAGSQAEFKTGEMLKKKWKASGFHRLQKMPSPWMAGNLKGSPCGGDKRQTPGISAWSISDRL